MQIEDDTRKFACQNDKRRRYTIKTKLFIQKKIGKSHSAVPAQNASEIEFIYRQFPELKLLLKFYVLLEKIRASYQHFASILEYQDGFAF